MADTLTVKGSFGAGIRGGNLTARSTVFGNKKSKIDHIGPTSKYFQGSSTFLSLYSTTMNRSLGVDSKNAQLSIGLA